MIDSYDLLRKDGWKKLFWLLNGRKPKAKFSLLKTWYKEFIKETTGSFLHWILYPFTRGIKPFWRLPEAPICPICQAGGEASCYHTGDGWVWGWECDHCGPDEFWWCDNNNGEPNDQAWDWPFLRYGASGKDWERLGILVN